MAARLESDFRCTDRTLIDIFGVNVAVRVSHFFRIDRNGRCGRRVLAVVAMGAAGTVGTVGEVCKLRHI